MKGEPGSDTSWHAYLSAHQGENLRADTDLTSNDFNVVKALVSGEVNDYMGFEFHWGQRAPITGSNIRDVYFWVKQSMQLAVSQEPRGFMDVIPSKRHSIQVRYELDSGATRMDEAGVVEILEDQSP